MEWNSIERATFQAFRGVVPSRRQLTQMIDTVRSYGVYEQESAATTPLRTQNARFAGYSVYASPAQEQEVDG